MTREEAKRRMEICRDFLANNYSDMGELNFTAFNMAIQALSQEPTDKPMSIIEDIKADLINEANEHMTEGDYNDGVRFGLMLAEQIVCRHQGKEQKSGKWIHFAQSGSAGIKARMIGRIEKMPTVDVLEQIRDEIKELSYPYNVDAMRVKSDVLQIIDKYTYRKEQTI